MSGETLLIIILVIVGIVAMVVLPQWRTKRAIPKVIQIFKEHNATSIKNAKTLEEIGIKLPSIMQELFSRRDYKQYALKGLMTAGVIQMTEDGKVYLSEETFLNSKFYRSQLGKT